MRCIRAQTQISFFQMVNRMAGKVRFMSVMVPFRFSVAWTLLSYFRRLSAGESVAASIAVIVSRTLLAFMSPKSRGKSSSSFSK